MANRYQLRCFPGTENKGWGKGCEWMEAYLGEVVTIVSGIHEGRMWEWGYYVIRAEKDGTMMECAPQCLVPIDDEDINKKVRWDECDWYPTKLRAQVGEFNTDWYLGRVKIED